MAGALTDVPGIKVGHWDDRQAVTGCTVVLCPEGAVAGGEVRGSAPATRDTDILRPINLVERVHAIVLSGGSAFGLDAAGGVMRYLEERGCGLETKAGRVPIVPAAALFDLGIGSAAVRPGAEEGYRAALAASDHGEGEGSLGAGTGATVGKALGMEKAVKGGLGMASQTIGNGIIVAALVAVNAFGDIVDPETGKTVAGPRGDRGFLNTLELLKQGAVDLSLTSLNTTLAVVATNAGLNKEGANKLCQMAQDGLARAIRPCHTMQDGDTVFALSLGEESADLTVLGSVAAEVVAQAVVRAVRRAEGLGGIPSVGEIAGKRRVRA
ncbi:MAG: P1 family peptidase [Dehalococcoidia bacterium]